MTDDPLEAMAKAQAVIDFTAPAATVALAGLAAQARAVHVIGTTGLTDDDLAKLDAAARHATIVRAGNMSLGVNLLVQLDPQGRRPRWTKLRHRDRRGASQAQGRRAVGHRADAGRGRGRGAGRAA